VLIAYPLIVIFVFDWMGTGSRWARKNRSMLLPADLKSREEKRGRPILLLKYFLLLGLMRCLIGNQMWRILPIATHTRTWLIIVTLVDSGAKVANSQHTHSLDNQE
jgi:hypothetical protein